MDSGLYHPWQVYLLLRVLQADALCHGPAGVAMVTLADSANSKGGQSLLGDMLCLLSSLLYALYTIAIRKMLPDDCQANVAGLFGLVGLLNLVCMAPVLVLLWSVSVVQLQGLTAWLVFLVICKGILLIVLSIDNCSWCSHLGQIPKWHVCVSHDVIRVVPLVHALRPADMPCCKGQFT